MAVEVTDPALLARLNAPEPSGPQEVTDPELLERLNAPTWGERADDFRTGLAASGINTYLGLKQMLGLSDEDDETVRQLIEQDLEDAGGWATAGKLTGDVAQMAIPGSAALKAGRLASASTRALPRALGAVASTPTRAGALAAAGWGASQPLSEEQMEDEGLERGAAAAKEALLAAAGGKAGELVATGISKTPEAIRALAAGRYLTPGQAAESKGVQALEAVMEVTPFVSRGTKAARQRGEDEWAASVLDAARAPGAPRVTKPGQEGFKQLDEGFDQAYSDVWARGPKVAPATARRRARQVLSSASDDFTPAVQRQMKRLWDELAESGVTSRQADKAIRKAMKSTTAKQNPEYMDVLQNARQAFRRGLAPELQEALGALDAKWPAYATARRATSGAAAAEGMFTPIQLARSGVSEGGRTAGARGEGPLMQEATEGLRTVGRKLGGQPLEWFRRITDITPTPIPMQAAGNVLLGNTRIQRALARALREAGLETAPGAASAAYYGE